MSYYNIHDTITKDFYALYKELFYNEDYKKLSVNAKWTYLILLDKLDSTNKQIDNEGILYLTLIREKLEDILNVSINTVTKIFKELSKAGLIFEVKQGFAAPNKIYVTKLEFIDITYFHKINEPIINTIPINCEVANTPIPPPDKQEILINEFTYRDIQEAKEYMDTFTLRQFVFDRDKFMKAIEIDTFSGNDKAMIKIAMFILTGLKERDKNLKYINRTVINRALTQCKSRIKSNVPVIRLFISDILKNLK